METVPVLESEIFDDAVLACVCDWCGFTPVYSDTQHHHHVSVVREGTPLPDEFTRSPSAKPRLGEQGWRMRVVCRRCMGHLGDFRPCFERWLESDDVNALEQAPGEDGKRHP